MDSFMKQQRLLRRLTQEEMAERLGITRPTYSSYERGAREMPTFILFALARFYGLPADCIWEKMQGLEHTEKGDVQRVTESICPSDYRINHHTCGQR